MWVVGNSDTLASDKMWSKLIKDAKNRACFMDYHLEGQDEFGRSGQPNSSHKKLATGAEVGNKKSRRSGAQPRISVTEQPRSAGPNEKRSTWIAQPPEADGGTSPKSSLFHGNHMDLKELLKSSRWQVMHLLREYEGMRFCRFGQGLMDASSDVTGSVFLRV